MADRVQGSVHVIVVCLIPSRFDWRYVVIGDLLCGRNVGVHYWIEDILRRIRDILCLWRKRLSEFQTERSRLGWDSFFLELHCSHLNNVGQYFDKVVIVIKFRKKIFLPYFSKRYWDEAALFLILPIHWWKLLKQFMSFLLNWIFSLFISVRDNRNIGKVGMISVLR